MRAALGWLAATAVLAGCSGATPPKSDDDYRREVTSNMQGSRRARAPGSGRSRAVLAPRRRAFPGSRVILSYPCDKRVPRHILHARSPPQP